MKKENDISSNLTNSAENHLLKNGYSKHKNFDENP